MKNQERREGIIQKMRSAWEREKTPATFNSELAEDEVTDLNVIGLFTFPQIQGVLDRSSKMEQCLEKMLQGL
jgi:hypothetical protein